MQDWFNTAIALVGLAAAIIIPTVSWRATHRRKVKLLLSKVANIGMLCITLLGCLGYIGYYIFSDGTASRIQNVLMVECVFLLFEMVIIYAIFKDKKSAPPYIAELEERVSKLEKMLAFPSLKN